MNKRVGTEVRDLISQRRFLRVPKPCHNYNKYERGKKQKPDRCNGCHDRPPALTNQFSFNV